MLAAEVLGVRRRLGDPRARGLQLRRRGAALAGIGALVLTAAVAGAHLPDSPGERAKPLPTGPRERARARPAVHKRETPVVSVSSTRVTRTTPVPILMYHVIAAAPDGAPYPDLYVTPRRFAEHVAYLARHRYRAVTLQQVWNHWHGGERLPPKPVVVSFDDGSRGWYTDAYPILRREGWVGSMNLTVSHLNQRDIPRRWVRRLIAAGWELASHTLTHGDLTLLSGADLRRELVDSRTMLRRAFGVPVDFFCYPSGRYDARVIAELRKAGYLGATTTVEGLAVPAAPFELKRIRVNGSDSASDLLATLAS
jgi:peptidoglycan/xylan/chitin deacetylase (PgdA/CDA1 family)